MNSTTAIDYVAAFKKTMRGVPTDLCCSAFNVISPGVNYRSCTKADLLATVATWASGKWSVSATTKLSPVDLADRYKRFDKRLIELSTARISARAALTKREEARRLARLSEEANRQLAEIKRLRFLREAKDLVRDAARGSDRADSADRVELVAWLLETLKTKGAVA